MSGDFAFPPSSHWNMIVLDICCGAIARVAPASRVGFPPPVAHSTRNPNWLIGPIVKIASDEELYDYASISDAKPLMEVFR